MTDPSPWTDDFDAPEAVLVVMHSLRLANEAAARGIGLRMTDAGAYVPPPEFFDRPLAYMVDGRTVSEAEFEAAQRDGKRHSLAVWETL